MQQGDVDAAEQGALDERVGENDAMQRGELGGGDGGGDGLDVDVTAKDLVDEGGQNVLQLLGERAGAQGGVRGGADAGRGYDAQRGDYLLGGADGGYPATQLLPRC